MRKRTLSAELNRLDDHVRAHRGEWLVFLHDAAVPPTNNHAERVLRRGVLWRKISFGCHSEAGCRFVELVLTVVQSLRLQERKSLNLVADIR